VIVNANPKMGKSFFMLIDLKVCSAFVSEPPYDCPTSPKF
jgi:hypothetical protein